MRNKLIYITLLSALLSIQANAMSSSECKTFMGLEIYKGSFKVNEAYTISEAKKGLIIDIREKEAYEELRPKNAISVPVVEIIDGKKTFVADFEENLLETLKGNKKENIMIIDDSEFLSHCVSNYLADKGYENVFNIKVGFKNPKDRKDWQGYKLPTESGKVDSLIEPKEHKKEETKPKKDYLSVYEKIALEKQKKDLEAHEEQSKIEAERQKEQEKNTNVINSIINKLPDFHKK